MKNDNLLQSFINAFCGLKNTFLFERNFKIHIFAAVLAICASFYFKLDSLSIAAVSLAAGAVLAAELINTAIEAVVDLYCGEKLSRHAKTAKDAAAAAVLVTSVIAVIVGILVFGDKFLIIFERGVQ